MPSAEEIRNDPEVKTFLKTYAGAADQAQRAIKILSKEEDGLAAVKKVLPALAEKTLFTFFSYKTKDEAAARTIVNLLRRYAAGKLKIAYQADFGKEIVGREWRDKIRTEVCKANWFILLLPDPSVDWDWCLYETGLFDRQPTSADRLICLHHPKSDIPSPIQDYHSVPATLEKVEEFLHMVFIDPDPIPGMSPINKYIEKDLKAIAKEIVDTISPPQKEMSHRIYEPFVKLQIDRAADLKTRDDLDSAIVKETNQGALDLFDRLDQARTWGELREGVVESADDGRWRDELFHVIRKIAHGRRFEPIQAIFHTQDGRIFQPVVHAIDREGAKGTIKFFYITFAEEISAVDTSAMPKGTATLANMLRLAFRFRWEVLEKYTKVALKEDDIERLTNVIRRIEQDAESRGILDENVDMSFFLEDQARRVGEMYTYWYALRNPADDSGELDIALKQKDIKEISAILAKMIPLNQEFLEMAADRFSELVANKL